MYKKLRKNICYISQSIDSTRIIKSPLSNIVSNLSEGIYKLKCKYRHDDKKFKTCGITYEVCTVFLNTQMFVLYDEKLKEQFLNTYQYSNHDNNKFILLLQKAVYPYEYINDLKKFNETSLPGKEDFYSHLNMEAITEAGYAHTKIVC